MNTATKFVTCCLVAGLTIAPWGTLLGATANDDDSAPHGVESTPDSEPAPGDDDSSETTSAAPANATQPAPAKVAVEVCDDDVDNDGDSLIDCADLNDCASFPTCGQIQGGWGWVISAYGLSFAALLAYTLMVTLRLRALQQRGKS